jgi:hypothetical protein
MNGSGGSGNVTIPNIKDWGCEPMGELDDDGAQVDIRVDFYSGGDVVQTFKLTVSNTVSDRLRRNPSPTNFYDRIIKDSGAQAISTPTGYTQIAAAWRQAGSRANRMKALADALIAVGVIAKGGVNGVPAGQGLDGPTS